MKPVWEEEFEDPNCVAFGAASSEILALIPRLRAGARVLDLGCGAGRNAIPLARAGYHVTAVDHSEAGLRRLLSEAEAESLAVETVLIDLAAFEFDDEYDLIVAHGVLHLLNPAVAMSLANEMLRATRPLGWNVVAVFTDLLPQPDDLAPFVHNVFAQGQLAGMYTSWDLELSKAYVLEDEHAGGIRHSHAVEKVVARRPGSGTV